MYNYSNIMKKNIILLFLNLISLSIYGQIEKRLPTLEELEMYRVFYAMEDALAEPTAVRKLFISSYDNQQLNGVIPKAIEQLVNLEELTLEGQGIIKLPDEIKALKNLKAIYLWENPKLDLVHTFNLLAELPNLSLLHLADYEQTGQPTKLPTEIGKLKKLKELNCIYSNMDRLPTEIGKLENLEILNLNGINFSNIPNELFNLRNLRSLSITVANATSTDIPNFIFDLPNLHKLRLHGCHLTNLPAGMAKLNQLQSLDLGNNPLLDLNTTLPILKKLVNLKELFMYNIYFDEMYLNQLSDFQSLNTLSLFFCGLSKLPSNFNQLRNIRQIYLAGNIFSDEEQDKIIKMFPNANVEF